MEEFAELKRLRAAKWALSLFINRYINEERVLVVSIDINAQVIFEVYDIVQKNQTLEKGKGIRISKLRI